MTTLLHSTVVSAFENSKKAESVIENLHGAGFTSEQNGIDAHGVPKTPGARASVDLYSRRMDVALGTLTGAVVMAILGATATWYLPGLVPIWLGFTLHKCWGCVGVSCGCNLRQIHIGIIRRLH